ncbi:MAG: T9SS type A sorting domain-containing protein [Bacteroidia bacterium]|nr:T9SS type A sorting domain-containing protein [Bacteroidia bacterium]
MLFQRFFLFSLTIVMPLCFQAQNYHLSNGIAASDDTGKLLKSAWAGGNNNTQFGNLDLNFDGKKDLVVFNRDGEKFSVYLNTGNVGEVRYEYSAAFESRFDSCKCIQWMLIKDYNGDGREDIFCGAGSGENIAVYKNIVYGGDSVGFELTYDRLKSLSNTLQNLYQDRTDIPAIVDVDYDGDLDIISTQAGFNLVALHRNRAMENFGNPDTLVYVKDSFCWGHFIESSSTNLLTVADTIFCPRGGDGGGTGDSRHSGTTLLVLDTDGDSLVECLIGDVSYPTAALLKNGGEIDHAFMTSVEYNYPQADSSIDVQLFPSFFHLDLNNDQIRDLVVTPNEPIAGENINGSVIYLNEGLDDVVDFRFNGRGFITGDHLDVGEKASPAFFDYNNDGLIDFVLGGGLTIYKFQDTFKMEIQFHLYENTGTPEKPAFKLKSRDYLGLNSLTPQIYFAAPAFGDLDGDGDKDLVLGNSLGTLFYFQNVAAPGTPANFQLSTDPFLRDINGDSLDVGSLSGPTFYDIDKDGDLDLFVGNAFGQIYFYQNNGGPTSPQLSFVTNQWGQIKEANQYGSFFSGGAKPFFANIDEDTNDELLVGSEAGFVSIYEDFSQALTDTVPRTGYLLDYRFGWFAAPAAAVLDTSGKNTLLVGNERGGVMLVSKNPNTTGPLATERELYREKVKVFPNPTQGWVEVVWDIPGFAPQQSEITVFTAMGQKVSETKGFGSTFRINLSGQASGMYFLRINSGGHTGQVKVWVGGGE